MSPPLRNVLPADPKPHHYTISISPDFDTFTFLGHVDIKLTASAPQQSITFNYNELTFTKVSVTCVTEGGFTQEVPIESVTLNPTEMKATVPLQKQFSGEAVLSIDYTGIMNDRLAGFYRSKCSVKGKETYIGVTQFEAVDARRAVPCWDEPALKAVFVLDVTAPSQMVVLSNTEYNKKENNGDKTRWFFDPTPVMSTYLLAWAIGEFDFVEQRIKKTYKEDGKESETVVRVYTPDGKKAQSKFALDVASKVLPLYEKFFESNYILPKVDLLAVPDFAAGAMENWGLITYRETALLCDDESSAAHRDRVAQVVAHELAHQWFGNLVTMEWWKELWLNESFATYMQYWAVDKIFPEWHVFTQFVHSEISRALSLDSLRSSHPVEVDVANAEEIDSIFDAISYSKGGSIVRMVINFIGETAFQKGMSAYLKNFAFSNARTVDLWTFLGQAAGRSLAPILENWTGKQGYPYLTVTSGPDGQTLHISQNRYLSTGDTKQEEDETIWKIPILVSTSNSTERKALVLEQRENTLNIPKSTWVKVNSDQSAFCRVLYKNEELLSALLPAIVSKQVTNIDRLGIISDYHAFARAGYCSTAEALKILLSYINEDDLTVWRAIIDFEADVRMLISSEGEKAIEKFNAFSRKLYSKAMETVGYNSKPGDSHTLIQLRTALFNRLAVAEDQNAISHALSIYKERQLKPIPSDFRYTVFSVFVMKNDKSAVEEVKLLAENAPEAMERTQYLRALGSSKVEGMMRELFRYALSDKVRSQDAIYVFIGLSSNPLYSKEFALELVREWPLLGKKFPGLLLGHLLSCASNVTDKSVASSLEDLWNRIDESERKGMTRNFQQSVESIRNNAAWASRDLKSVMDFISSFNL